MYINFTFSRRYSECRAVRSIGVCCYSNTGSTGVLLEQQSTVAQSMGSHADDKGGL
jgi:hypothetical protein